MRLSLIKKALIGCLIIFIPIQIFLIIADLILFINKMIFHGVSTKAVVLFALLTSLAAAIFSVFYVIHDYVVGKKQAKDLEDYLKRPGAVIYCWTPRSTFFRGLAEKVIRDNLSV